MTLGPVATSCLGQKCQTCSPQARLHLWSYCIWPIELPAGHWKLGGTAWESSLLQNLGLLGPGGYDDQQQEDDGELTQPQSLPSHYHYGLSS